MSRPAYGPRGPWWVTSFQWQGRACVIRFRLGADLKPTRVELVSGNFASGEPSRALKRNAVLAFVARHRPLIEDAFALAGDSEAARRMSRREGYAA